MMKTVQRSTLESLLVTHGGDFAAAYAELAAQAGDEVVSESLAQGWVREYTRKAKAEEGRTQLAMVMSGQGLPTKAADFAKLERDKKLAAFDEEFLTFAHALVADHAHDIFEPRERVTGIPKVAELLGTPTRLQHRRSGPQEAHRSVPHVANTFGSLTDRQVMTFYVREGENVAYLTHTLRAFDPALAFLSEETVTEKLRLWQKDGVVMDADGTVMAWDDALLELQVQLRTLNPSPSI